MAIPRSDSSLAIPRTSSMLAIPRTSSFAAAGVGVSKARGSARPVSIILRNVSLDDATLGQEEDEYGKPVCRQRVSFTTQGGHRSGKHGPWQWMKKEDAEVGEENAATWQVWFCWAPWKRPLVEMEFTYETTELPWEAKLIKGAPLKEDRVLSITIKLLSFSTLEEPSADPQGVGSATHVPSSQRKWKSQSSWVTQHPSAAMLVHPSSPQASAVHGSPSSQSMVVPAHAPS